MTLSNREMTIWLNYNRVDSAAFEKLEEEFPVLNEILDDSAIFRLKKCLSPSLIEKISKYNHPEQILSELSEISNKNYKIMTHYDSDFPPHLKIISRYPRVLYYRGNPDLMQEDSIAVVGARKITDYGKWACKHFVDAFSEYNLTLVSGLALGTDGLAHKSALENRMKTVGVLGTGIDIIFPEQNKSIFEQMYSDGLVISEFPPGTPGLPMNFPIRNRIISGLSKVVIVIEAKKRSGSLITARLAMEQGKEVFAVPGNINSVYSQGTNELIRDGVQPLLAIEDVLKEFDHLKRIRIDILNEKVDLSDTEKKILLHLSEAPQSAEKLAERLDKRYVEICSILTILEIKGYLIELNGGIFSLK